MAEKKPTTQMKNKAPTHPRNWTSRLVNLFMGMISMDSRNKNIDVAEVDEIWDASIGHLDQNDKAYLILSLTTMLPSI